MVLVEVTALMCRITAIITTFTGTGVPTSVQLADKNKTGASGVMVIVTEIGHGDTSSNPGLIAFHIALIPLGKV